eukprot:5626782-Pleurochrysis_carterae.AAC.1
MDDKIYEREQKHQATTDQRNAHLLVSVSEAPSRVENFTLPFTPTSRMGALAVNSPFDLFMADDPNPNISSKFLMNQKRDRRGSYVLVETLEDSVSGIDGKAQLCTVMGDMPIRALDASGKSIDLTLRNVRCVPTFSDSLLS